MHVMARAKTSSFSASPGIATDITRTNVFRKAKITIVAFLLQFVRYSQYALLTNQEHPKKLPGVDKIELSHSLYLRS